MGQILERKLAAIMFTDIAGYTAQMSKDETIAISMLNKKESILKPLIKNHNGTYVKGTGDGSLSYFNSAVDAALCAKNLQESIYDDKNLNIRIGVHLGDTIFEKDGDIRGEGVNIAARLENMAVEGGVFISKEVQDQLVNQKDFEGISLGLQSMKGIGRLIEVYGLRGNKLNEPDPEKYQNNKISRHSDNKVPSIAIIPFENKGSDDDEFYTYSISTDLIRDITNSGIIRVASLKEVEELKEIPYKEKAKKLNVRYLSTGSLWKIKDIFQLSVELYDTKKSMIIWSDRWQENWENLQNIQRNLSDGLLKAFNIKKKSLDMMQINSTEAYEVYLRGMYIFKQRKTKKDVQISRRLLEKAIELDINLTKAKTYLAYTYFHLTEYKEASKILEPALKYAEKNNDKESIGVVLRTLGETYFKLGETKKSIDYLNRSFKILDEIGDMHEKLATLNSLGIYYGLLNKDNKKIEALMKAIKICRESRDDVRISVFYNNLGSTYVSKENFDKASKYFNKVIAINKSYNKSHLFALGNMARLNYMQFNYEESLKFHEEIIKGFKESQQRRFKAKAFLNAGYMYEYTGKTKKALEYYLKAKKISEQRSNKINLSKALYRIGMHYYMNLEFDNAIKYLKKSCTVIKKIDKNIDRQKQSLNNHKIILNTIYKKSSKKYVSKDIKNIKLDQEFEDYTVKNYYASFEILFFIYELTDDIEYLNNSHKDIIFKSKKMKSVLRKKFLNYPFPKRVITEYNKVFK